MGYALPVELVLKKNEIGDINKLVKEVNDEINALKKDYEIAKIAIRSMEQRKQS